MAAFCFASDGSGVCGWLRKGRAGMSKLGVNEWLKRAVVRKHLRELVATELSLRSLTLSPDDLRRLNDDAWDEWLGSGSDAWVENMLRKYLDTVLAPAP